MRGRRTVPALLALVLISVATAACAQIPGRAKRDVPYVPTKTPVVDLMLEGVAVKPGDVIYDLGCGDGRIVIAAATRYGIRGVGIDINPDRIAEARDNARRAGVSDRVTFIQGNLFDADIREATVVALYLLPSINLRLRPKLLSDLKPGTRIVSHNYDMGDWPPERSETITVDGTEHIVYWWTVPPPGGRP